MAQLLPFGEFKARDGRPGPDKSYKITDAKGGQIAAALNALAAATPIVVDYDHQTIHSLTTGAKAPAAGWITGVEWRAGAGLFATVEWTDTARAHILAREYLYISPVILFDEATGEVRGVAMASLVNLPAIVGMEPAVAALSAFTSVTHDASPPAETTPRTQPQQEPSDMALLASLIALLGLPATTDDAAALSAVTTLKTTATTPPAKAPLTAALSTALGLAAGADEAAALSAITALKTPDTASVATIAALQTQLAALTAQVNGATLTKTVDEAIAAGKLVPAQRDWALQYGGKDMAALSAFIAAAPVIALAGQTAGKQPGGLTGGAGGTVAEAALATEVMRGFGLTSEQFAKGAAQTAAV